MANLPAGKNGSLAYGQAGQLRLRASSQASPAGKLISCACGPANKLSLRAS